MIKFQFSNNKTRSKDQKLKTDQGFTLIEILVASALMVLLGVAFVGMQYILSENQTSAWRNYLSIEQANGAVSTMEKELRNANQSETGSYPLETANDQEIVFYSDYDYDGIVERIRYSLSENQLIKGVVEPTGDPLNYVLANEVSKVVSSIVRNASDPLFYYYNSDWPSDSLSNPLISSERISDTREIKMILITNPDSSSDEYNYVLEGSAKIRMLIN